MHYKMSVAAAAVLAVMSPVWAAAQQDAGAEVGIEAEVTAETADHQFVNEAAAGGIAEVRLAETAMQRAGSNEVLQLAEHLHRDHTQANQELIQIAQQRGIEVPQQPGPEQQQVIDHLSQLEGEEFDQAFLQAQEHMHREKIELFERQAQQGQDEELRSFAERHLPVLEEHAQMVRAAGEQVVGMADDPMAEDEIARQDGIDEFDQPVGEPGVEAEGDAPQIVVDPGDPEIIIEMQEPQVTVEQPEPEVRIEPAEPEVVIEQADPEVRVERADPDPALRDDDLLADDPMRDDDLLAEDPMRDDDFVTDGLEPDRDITADPGVAEPGIDDPILDEPEVAQPVSPVFDMTTEEIVGRDLIDATGSDIGSVRDVVLDQATNQVYAVVSVGGFLGIGAQRIPLPLEELQLVEGGVMSNLTEEQIRELPRYEEERYVVLSQDQRVGDAVR